MSLETWAILTFVLFAATPALALLFYVTEVADDVRDGCPVACAALHRWRHDRRQFPAGFVAWSEACQCQACGAEWVRQQVPGP